MPRKKQTIYWGAITLDTFSHLQDNDLQGADYKVLFLLCHEMMKENNIAYLKQKNISEKLELHKSSISKAIKKLTEKQIIAKVENGFMINPHLFYVGRGKAEYRREIRYEFDSTIIEKNLRPRFEMDEAESELRDYGYSFNLNEEEKEEYEEEIYLKYDPPF